MTDRPGPDPADHPDAAVDGDAGQWREAARLRREHPRWVIIWLPPIRQFRAYAPGARRDTALTAATPAGLAGLINRAEQAAPDARHPKDST
jgi:hypothetical protein